MKTVEQEFEECKETLIIYEELIGKSFAQIVKSEDTLEFLGEDSYRFYHEQDCCESVYIEDVCGDLKDLENSPILIAEEVSREALGKNSLKKDREVSEFGTWTFYKFATAKGHVTVRWIGESNGYYSESVNFKKIKNRKK